MLPSKPTLKVRIAEGPVALPLPVAMGDTVFVGYEEHEILRLDLPRADPVWRVPANGYSPDYCIEGILVLRGAVGYRGLYTSGEPAWALLDGANGGTGWGRYGDRLFSLNPGIFVAAATTGLVTDHHDVPGLPISGASLCDETLLLRGPGGGDPVRAYDMSRRQILWERDLTTELRSSATGRKSTDDLFSAYAGSRGRLVVRLADSLFGLSIDDGQVLWHTPLNLGSNPPVMADGRIYAWAWSKANAHEQHLVCLDEATGALLYMNPLAQYGGDFALFQDALVGRPVAGHLAFGARSGLLALFRLSDGALVWSHKSRTQVYWPVLAANRLLVTTGDGSLLVFG